MPHNSQRRPRDNDSSSVSNDENIDPKASSSGTTEQLVAQTSSLTINTATNGNDESAQQLAKMMSQVKIHVKPEIQAKLKLVCEFKEGELGPWWDKFQQGYMYRILIKDGRVGVVLQTYLPTAEFLDQGQHSVRWIDQEYPEQHNWNCPQEEKYSIEDLKPYLTPFFSDNFFEESFPTYIQLEFSAMQDNNWFTPPVSFYRDHIKKWYSINSYTLMEHFPYDKIRAYMVTKYDKVQKIQDKTIRMIKEHLERKINSGVDQKIELDEDVIRETYMQVQSLCGDEFKVKQQVVDSFDVTKMDKQKLLRFLSDLVPQCAPAEFYEENIERLVCLTYIRKLPSGDKFEELLTKCWRGTGLTEGTTP
eukprot:TRINITY_DN6584_c0_g2_i1.p2 TRINITY_DN6584_c0_g2~~TRINITY_DN6584_c0_g2_i1.p2  ORF type:complete len:391 (-),score=60.39 TRINITY_DN6584_c0_g2_i1:910-1995(-)